jgi:hypothetical protein
VLKYCEFYMPREVCSAKRDLIPFATCSLATKLKGTREILVGSRPPSGLLRRARVCIAHGSGIRRRPNRAICFCIAATRADMRVYYTCSPLSRRVEKAVTLRFASMSHCLP